MSSIAEGIPFEIWAQVASYLPSSTRQKLLSLNRSFLSIALQERYGEVRWAVLDRGTVRQLERLQEPSVAQRVRMLYVQSWFIHLLIQRARSQQPEGNSSTMSGLLSSTFGAISSSLRNNAVNPSGASSTRAENIISHKVALELMINALSNMTRLTCYSFEWRDHPLSPDFRDFLTAAQNSTHILRKLSLRAQLSNFKHLLQFFAFEQLEDLVLYFDYDTQNGDNFEALTSFIGPFINHFKDTLRTISVSSSSLTSLAPLFDSLETFPKLLSFELKIPFDSHTFPSAESLIQFLGVHSKFLKNLNLSPLEQSQSSLAHSIVADSEERRSCIKSLLESVVLSGLETLYLPVSGTLETTLKHLHQSSKTLKRLCLSGRYLSKDDMVAVLDVFSQRSPDSSLEYLRIEVQSLNMTVLSLIADRIPGLQELVIITEGSIATSRWDYDLLSDPFIYSWDGSGSVLRLAEAFLPERTVKILHEWKLCNLSIYAHHFQEFQTASFSNSKAEYWAMDKVKRFVPSIQYFKGQDYADLTTEYRYRLPANLNPHLGYLFDKSGRPHQNS